ncbi:hypothetical protein [Wenzhouxiangella sp. EGI_FJ10305]|uniref:hypothetical protein n=1 Tax=Wenzhouxiangella sp. EGI_FJ10305 TaxID=3243768 RepID=UPI0035E10C71
MKTRQAYLTRDSIADLLRLGSLLAVAVGLFAVVIGALAVYLNLSAQLELERSDRAASRQADRIADALDEIQTDLRDASVVDAVRTGSNDRLRAALRERGVVSILDIRLLPADINEIAVGEYIGLDLGTTEMVIEAIRNERADIRVLQPGTPAENLVMAQRMPGDTGVLLLRLTVSVVTSLLRDDEMLDFVALAQQGNPGAIILDARGRSATGPIHPVSIADTSLVLQWTRGVMQAPLDNQAAVILGASGVIVLMIGLLIRRRTRLARYLGHPEQAGANPGKHRARGAPSRDGGTVVMAPDDEEPPTMVARSPDLPAWLSDEDKEETPPGRS